MHPMAIIGIALGAGVIVYTLSLRTGDERLTLRPAEDDETQSLPPPPRRRGQGRAVGFDPSEPPVTQPEPFTYVPLAADETPWQRRVAGLFGIVVLVAAAAAALAGAVYQLGHIVNQTIARFLK